MCACVSLSVECIPPVGMCTCVCIHVCVSMCHGGAGAQEASRCQNRSPSICELPVWEQDPRSSSVRLANTLNAEPPISTVLHPRLLLKVLSFRPDGLDVGRTENGKSGNKNKTFLVAQALSFRLPGLCSYYLKSNKKIDCREKRTSK